ncbi:MAG: peptide deformylase [Bacteroidales bacterium]|nr:peptide deformylase [Bacteroidales bacterium]MBN2756035.1 peptide deformylase [Bacteroidales bacterium]
MVFPVSIIGSSVLRQVAKDIDKNYPELDKFIENMFETMDKSDGVGLAAPQIGKSIRLFVIDTSPMSEDDPSLINFRKVFINARIIERTGDFDIMEEGCLSIPGISEEVKRETKIVIEYVDENFEFHRDEYEGLAARVIQHEYDHLDGVLFTDRISPLRKKLIKGKLLAISKGKFEAKYKFKLQEKKRT